MRQLNQTGLIRQDQMDAMSIYIVGTGAIGSFVAMGLSKMGFKKIVTWDHDKIEDHNIANQMFPVEQIGVRKAVATQQMVKQFSGENILCLAIKATGKTIADHISKYAKGTTPIVIFAVDSLDVRKEIFEELQRSNRYSYIIDGRMGAKTYRVIPVRMWMESAKEEYRKTLIPDTEAVQERCGQKSIIYTVFGVAAEICNMVHCCTTPVQINPEYEDSEFIIPPPVAFDYATGYRMQKREIKDLVKI